MDKLLFSALIFRDRALHSNEAETGGESPVQLTFYWKYSNPWR